MDLVIMSPTHHFPMKLARLLVLGYLVLMPWSVLAFPSLHTHDYARVVQIGLMLACTTCLFAARPVVTRCPASRQALWLAVVMIVQTVLSTTMADRPEWAAREVGLVLGLIGVASTTACAANLRELRQDIGAVVVALAIYAALTFFITAMSLLDRQPLLWREISIGYSHPRFLNHVQTVALPLLAVAAGWFPPRSLARVAAWFALVSSFALLWFTGGRATLLTVALSSVACLLLLRAQARPTMIRLAMGMVLGFVLYLVVFIGAPALLDMPVPFELSNRAKDAGSVYSRLLLWQQSWAQISASPLFGAGPMHFAHQQNLDAAHPHNIYLQIAGEWGLPMLGAVLLAAWLALRRLQRAVCECKTEVQASVGAGLLCASIAVAFDGFLSGNFVMPMSQVWIAALIGWAMAWVRLKSASGKPSSAQVNSIAVSIAASAIAISQLALVTAVVSEFWHLPEFLNATSIKFPSSTTNPRFWSHGWF